MVAYLVYRVIKLNWSESFKFTGYLHCHNREVMGKQQANKLVDKMNVL
jgi:hypothetical protein